jgi:deazaflavin-dependent oxidoreductase (nitroreductase family)
MAGYNDSVIEEFRANKGKISGNFVSMDLLLVTTTGAKSGNKFTVPVAYTMDGDKYVIIASKGGSATHPDWYHNLVKNPEVEIEVGEEKFPAKAEITEDPERERLYSQHADKYPMFNDYKQKTDRKIPVILLERIKS